ncbi:sensor domain-containing diguanylate cyclase [Marinimicrobium alkaliphilum]|uniref:sensor domain-containing diguanylate cyclase n=1 Tax=Marinimicrobium alkaliphilum TaxID=2202654 RepID=UPI000DB9A4D4|nr:sensor domain-containing diguanylate cyclase [Marinimicrobium alkaliphilum]
MNKLLKGCLSPDQEEVRLAALAAYEILDTPEEAAFDELVEVAAYICDAPIAVINFVDRHRQWFKAVKGLGVRETPLDVSICAHAIMQPGLFIVPDTTRDPRFAQNPLVTGEPHLRFYAGALLESHDGQPLGTLCVLDYKPRTLSERQAFALQALANQVMAHMELMLAHRQQVTLIRDLDAARKEMTHWASTDSLTGLLNRRAFEQRLSQELALVKRGARPGALMMLDLDDFKRINDNFGHHAGDDAIVCFADACREVFRQADVVGRWGGEEFIILLPSTELGEAGHAAERLHQSLSREPIARSGSEPLTVTASIGLCALTPDGELDDTLRNLDALLYQAKRKGRNCTVCEVIEQDDHD